MDLTHIFDQQTPRWNVDIADQLNAFPILVIYQKRIQRTTFHRQPGVEIHLTHEGKGIFVHSDQVFNLSPRQVLIFRGNSPHQLVADSDVPYKRTVVCLDDTLLTGIPSQLIDYSWVTEEHCHAFILPVSIYLYIEELTHKLYNELEMKGEDWPQMSLAHTLELSVLLRRAFREEQSRSLPSFVSSMDQLVRSCAEYVAHHLNEDVSLTVMAAKYTVSPEHLTRMFKKEFGINYHQYVLLQRVVMSKRFMGEYPQLPIIEIAAMVGFDSPSHFSTTFRKITGITPSAYKKHLAAFRPESK
jgi:AraC-like DNA-binding protein